MVNPNIIYFTFGLKLYIKNNGISKAKIDWTEVIIITPGCGYLEEPKLSVSKPNSPNGKQAVVATKVYNQVIQEYPSFSQEELEQRLPKEY